MWQWAQVEEALDFMAAHGLNGLIFHQNDLIDQLVVPTRYFPDELMLKRWPVRLHTIENNRQYINKVVRAASARGINFFLQVKELWFPDGLMRIFPAPAESGRVPVPEQPLLVGVPGRKDERIADGRPRSGRCGGQRRNAREQGLHFNQHLRLRRPAARPPRSTGTPGCSKRCFKPLDARGKLLAVRDFSYSADQQGHMIRAAEKCSDRIVISLKNTPHDYYPTFPDNPAIGRVGGLRQWIEFDTWGQFYGLGFFPAGVAEDMRRRMLHCRAEGAIGISLRTDWEVITEGSAFNSLNMLNVFAGAALSSDLDAGLDDVYRSWAAGVCDRPSNPAPACAGLQSRRTRALSKSCATSCAPPGR